MSDDEIITVVQAHKEGKRIQRHTITWKDDHWVYDDNPDWDFVNVAYRVITEPRKPREWRLPASMLDAADIIKGIIQRDEPIIIVREVIEDGKQHYCS